MVDPREDLAHLRLASSVAGVEVAEVVLPAERDVVVGGIRLHYLDWGRADGAPVVFLHGGCLTARTWDLVCLALRDEYRCIALDQRGHGDSEWSPTMDYGFDAHAADLAAFLDHLELARPVLVGQSMGALNAMTYAASHAGRPAGLVVIDAGPDVRAVGTEPIVEFVLMPAEAASVDEFVARAVAFNPARDERLLRRSLLHNLRALPDGRWTWKYDRRHLSRELFASISERLAEFRGRVPSITCPTLVVRGKRSEVFTDEDARRLARSLPDGRWARVEGAGHTVQGDNPRGLVEALRPFLREIA